MRAAVESDRKGGGAQLRVVRGQTVVTNAAHGYCVYIGRITVAVTVVICQSAIPRCPDVDVAFTISALESNRSRYECGTLRIPGTISLKLGLR